MSSPRNLRPAGRAGHVGPEMALVPYIAIPSFTNSVIRNPYAPDATIAFAFSMLLKVPPGPYDTSQFHSPQSGSTVRAILLVLH